MRVGLKILVAGNPENRQPKTLINRGLKNTKHGKRASCIGDGYLTVLDFEVLISLELKIPEMQFLKRPKKGKNAPPKKHLKNRV
jgi:hypothetical protein